LAIDHCKLAIANWAIRLRRAELQFAMTNEKWPMANQCSVYGSASVRNLQWSTVDDQ
jgi:hypothetical protein